MFSKAVFGPVYICFDVSLVHLLLINMKDFQETIFSVGGQEERHGGRM